MAIDHCILTLGAMKCGTTSLYQYLEQHPDIASSTMKEPLFFSSDEIFARGRAWYESLYPDADRSAWTLDGSTDCTKYPFCGDVPARMLAFGGKFRLIYIMRNPLRRIESHARHAQMFGTEINELPSDRADHGLDHGISDISLAVSDYAAQIDRFRPWYDRGEMLLLTSEELRRDPLKVVGRVFDFIGLPPLADLRPPAYQNRTGELVADGALAGLLKRHPVIAGTLRRVLPAPIRALGKRPIEVPGRFTLTKAEEEMLVDRLKASLVRLRDTYGIDAAQHWDISLPAR